MDHEYTSLAYVASNVIAVITVIVVVLWPKTGRVLLSGIFIGAAVINAITVIQNPSLYLRYSETATLDFYRHIITGPFSKHTPFYVLIISAGQLLIGGYLIRKGAFQKIAAWGGILFLLAIVPLGIGSAFPCSLILATALIFLLKKDRIRSEPHHETSRKSHHAKKTGHPKIA